MICEDCGEEMTFMTLCFHQPSCKRKPSDLPATPQAARFEKDHGDLTEEELENLVSAPSGEYPTKDRSKKPLYRLGKIRKT